MRGLFFTGTDTGVGKTVITAAVARGLRRRNVRVGVCKPVATGAELRHGHLLAEDTSCLASAAGLEHLIERITPWVFPDPVAPPIAAARQRKTLSLVDMIAAVRWWAQQADFVLVEGVGGLLCPLTERETVAELAQELGLPLVIVARTTLGTLNHTLLTLEAAAHRNLKIAGVVLNQVEPPGGSLAEETNVAELKRRIQVPILAVVPHQSPPHLGRIEQLDTINWEEL